MRVGSIGEASGSARRPILDVVSVTWNSEPWIPRLLRSLEPAVAAGDATVTVVDNASTDGTVEVARSTAPWATVVANERNRWLSPALNQGAAMGAAPYLMLINPDCEVLTPDWPQRVVEVFDRRSPGLVGPRLLDEDGAVQFTGRSDRKRAWFLGQVSGVSALRGRLGRAPDWRWRPEWDRSTTEPVDVVSGACMVIPRALFEALGGLDEGFRLYFEEDDLCRRVRKAGSDVLLCAEIEVMHAWAKSTSQMDPALRSAIGQESLFRAAEKRYGTWFRRVLQGASVPRRAVSAIRSRRRAPAA